MALALGEGGGGLCVAVGDGDGWVDGGSVGEGVTVGESGMLGVTVGVSDGLVVGEAPPDVVRAGLGDCPCPENVGVGNCMTGWPARAEVMNSCQIDAGSPPP